MDNLTFKSTTTYSSDDRQPVSQASRRTASDDVFDFLHSRIINMELEPGAKMSETEIAKQLGVSRQPVREAFIRLSNMKLLEIRPQRATIVRKIHQKEFLDARFIRAAIEIEVCRHAAIHMTAEFEKNFIDNLSAQKAAMEKLDFDKFHNLDQEFHYLICLAGKCEFAFEKIVENRSHIDRLCALALSTKAHFEEVYEDHVKIFEYLKNGSEEQMAKAIRQHLTRVDKTIENVRGAHPHYFED